MSHEPSLTSLQTLEDEVMCSGSYLLSRLQTHSQVDQESLIVSETLQHYKMKQSHPVLLFNPKIQSACRDQLRRVIGVRSCVWFGFTKESSIGIPPLVTMTMLTFVVRGARIPNNNMSIMTLRHAHSRGNRSEGGVISTHNSSLEDPSLSVSTIYFPTQPQFESPLMFPFGFQVYLVINSLSLYS